MLNLKVGSPREADGRTCILTARGTAGFAIYGPYQEFRPGEYAVEFMLAAPEGGAGGSRVALLDVTRNAGNAQLTSRAIAAAELGPEWRRFVLTFSLAEPARLEFRVWVGGEVPLLVADAPSSAILIAGDDPAEVMADPGFPGAARERLPFLAAHERQLRELHDLGVVVRARADGIVLGIGGVAMHARTADDLNFIHEIFFERAYNLKAGRDLCVIDIGMNIGLASLMFAAKPEVREVHAFEPFAETFARASGNLALNPALAAKISARNAGLSDREVSGPLQLLPAGDSGSFSTVEHVDGRPTELVLHDAGAALAPIIADARARGLDVVVKVDCEGSEFAVFESLERHGLLEAISGFMVEWHAMFHDRDQETLLAPLRRRGFLIFDRSPPRGNGFFYAARLASAAA